MKTFNVICGGEVFTIKAEKMETFRYGDTFNFNQPGPAREKTGTGLRFSVGEETVAKFQDWSGWFLLKDETSK